MGNIEIYTKVLLINGRHASKKNMGKIFAVSSTLCTNVHGYGIDPKTYKERWAIKIEDKGYIFREVTHGGGICGHHKTIRRLLIHSSGYPHIKLIFEQVDEKKDHE